jgi:large subunit ribosomal protein L15
MMLHEITASAGARERRKRVGRGESSGMGRTSGRGNKGAQSRAGCSIHPLKEGGQMPLFRRLPKRGFSNFHFRTEYAIVNLLDLESAFENGASVSVATLRELGAFDPDAPVKILGEGELKKKLTVEAHAVSAKAKAAIEKAGGSFKLLPLGDSAAKWKEKRNSRKKAGPQQRSKADVSPRLTKKNAAAKA